MLNCYQPCATLHLMWRVAVVIVSVVLGACAPTDPPPTPPAPRLRPSQAESTVSSWPDDDIQPHLHDANNGVKGSGPSLHPGTNDPSYCSCIEAKFIDGWCEFHTVGWVAGLRVRSSMLFETLDPHGHEIGHDSVTCSTCRTAITNDGYCDPCHIGWQRGLGYMTRLTWLLSKGRRATDSVALCGSCRLASTAPARVSARWCTACKGGVVGNVFFRDRELFDKARLALDILRVAIAECPRCELCACAMVYDRRCPDCGITYLDGRPVMTGLTK